MKRLPRKHPLLSRDAGLLLLTLLLTGAVGTRFPQFVTPTNLKSVLDDTSILILLALAQTPVLLTRSIDLSVAANLALTGMCVALFNHAFPDVGMPAIIILAIAIGATLVTMERPAPDSQTVGYAADRVRTVAQSHIRRGAGGEKRTICRLGCPCSDHCGGGG